MIDARVEWPGWPLHVRRAGDRLQSDDPSSNPAEVKCLMSHWKCFSLKRTKLIKKRQRLAHIFEEKVAITDFLNCILFPNRRMNP